MTRRNTAGSLAQGRPVFWLAWLLCLAMGLQPTLAGADGVTITSPWPNSGIRVGTVRLAADTPTGCCKLVFRVEGPGVRFTISGVPEPGTATFEATFDTRTVPDGRYTITATAAAGLASATSAPVTVVVQNGAIAGDRPAATSSRDRRPARRSPAKR